jgi:uncharacterized protein (UPF0332 family)
MNTKEKQKYLEKALKQYEAGILLLRHGFNNDSLSRLYYAFRSLAICIVGKPLKGKWKHPALMKKVIMEIDNKRLFSLSREERKLIKDFPDLREEADYDPIEIPEEKIQTYIKLVERFLREVKNYVEYSNQD